MTFQQGVIESSAQVGALKVQYYDSQNGKSGKAIVLVHGTSGSAENSFWTLFPMLSMRHRVVAMDLVDAEDPHSPVDGYVAQVLAVIRAVSPTTPVELVGYSFGAVIAASTAARHPEYVASLTLVAGWLKTDVQQKLRNDIWFALHDSGHPALAAFTTFTNFSSAYLRGRLPGELNALLTAVDEGPDRAAKMRFNRDVDIEEEAISVSAPTLVIACADDQTVPVRHSHLLFGAIPNARFFSIDAGHGVMLERPSEVFTAIDRFVREPAAQPAGTILTNDHA